ncbi:MAG TPA: HlyD family efflux transporter periplasmic adaptor subunit [Stellaceae bacterium]|nr:HlyD family efflux transporter periplasmic adaptor subunit [Stellaceae bacterium]
MNSEEKTRDGSPVRAENQPEMGELLAPVRLPTTISPPYIPPWRRRWIRGVLLVIVLIAAGFGGMYLWRQSWPHLPPSIVYGNGRLESDEIDIDTKFAGRIAKLLVDEGDMVTAGQIVALMDTRDLEASLKKAEAFVLQSEQARDEAKATVEQQKSQVLLAQQEVDRARYLVSKGSMPRETLDQRQQQYDGAVAALNAATARVRVTEHALEAATHDVELYKIEIADNALVAPRDGRIQYRVANVGEVLGAGGRIFTMLDISYVYMDIYLPTVEAGHVKIGSDARIVLDAYPTYPIPAKVVFIATQAQFTPKTVETREERDKLMFRIRVRVDPDLLRAHAESVRSGLPGVGYIQTDASVPWPPQLERKAP